MNKKFFEPQQPSYNRYQAARIIGVSHTWLKALEQKGMIPAPSIKVGKRDCYSQAELDQIKLVLEAAKQRQAELDKMYSKAEVCKILNVNPVVLQWHLKHDAFPKPLQTLTKHVYTAEEVYEIKRYFESRKMADKTLVLFQKYFYSIGGTQAELAWVKRKKNEHLIPQPAFVLPGNSLRTKYYRKKDIKALVKKIRVLRGNRPISDKEFIDSIKEPTPEQTEQRMKEWRKANGK